jgi:ferritin-like metal-binding protein YciE
VKVDSLDTLFLHELGDLYNAEQQITKALPKMVAEASSPDLQKALEEHLEVTRVQIERLEQVFEALGTKAPRLKCKGMEGLIKEGADLLDHSEDPSVLDAGIVGAAQKVEHYEIAGYGTAIAYAQTLGHNGIINLLEQTLEEEKAADKTLTRLAEQSLNSRAAHPGTSPA